MNSTQNTTQRRNRFHRFLKNRGVNDAIGDLAKDMEEAYNLASNFGETYGAKHRHLLTPMNAKRDWLAYFSSCNACDDAIQTFHQAWNTKIKDSNFDKKKTVSVMILMLFLANAILT